MALNYNPFESEFGFSSPGFSVDLNGNVTLRSITYTVAQEEEAAETDFTFTDTGVVWREESQGADNPSISLERGSTYTFSLNQTNFRLNIKNELGTANYNEGISWTDGTNSYTGANAQNQQGGIFTFEVPNEAPDTLRYSHSTGAPYGTINITDPVVTGNGAFKTLTVTQNLNAQGQDADIRLQPTGNGSVNINAASGNISGLGISATSLSVTGLTSIQPQDSNVTIIPLGSGRLTINSGAVGTIDNVNIGTGSPGTGAFTSVDVDGGSIDGAIIGANEPAAATFTTVSTTTAPTGQNNLVNKKYVDSNSIAFAIVLGT